MTPNSSVAQNPNEKGPRNVNISADVEKHVTFGVTKVFYFKRCQGTASVPDDGGISLGMEPEPFLLRTFPISGGKPCSSEIATAAVTKTTAAEPPHIKELPPKQRRKLLTACDVRIRMDEAKENRAIMMSRKKCGCRCFRHCNPRKCRCALEEISCYVNHGKYPCACSKQNCSNPFGRRAFDEDAVSAHYKSVFC
ncbi:unnamed protein product [Soboliphyme baturini]|uniref:CSRNP_N domain-containing protein n=1 Tax=Soboliphyme baturini TaxID=241478 RepID=A0A183IZJ4_9BILA|nr:unnamed protein product [Soboliphyme baturini]